MSRHDRTERRLARRHDHGRAVQVRRRVHELDARRAVTEHR